MLSHAGGPLHVSDVARSPSARSSCCSLRRRSCRAGRRRGRCRRAHRRARRSTRSRPAPRPAPAGSPRACAPRSSGSSDTGRTVGRIATKVDPDQLARQPGSLRRLRRPALLPAHRLDRPHRGRRPAPGSAPRRPHHHRPPRRTAENTGDLARSRSSSGPPRSTPQARAAAERQELTEAARSVAKVWLLRHEVQGVAAAPPTSSRATPRPGRRSAPADGASPRSRAIADYPEPGRDPHRGRGPRRSGAPTGAARRRCR